MPKSYMNKAERSHFLFLNALTAKSAEVEEELSAHSSNKEMLKNLRSGITFLRKAQQAWADQVDDTAIDKVVREASLYDVGLIFHKDSQKHIISMEERDRAMRKQAVAELGRDPIFDLCEWVMKLACRQCSGYPRCREGGCSIYTALDSLQMPQWEPSHDKCPYAWSGLSETKYEA